MIQDQTSGRDPRCLRQIEVRVVDAQNLAADTVPEAHPAADSLDAERRAGARLVDGFFEPEGVAAEFFKTLAVEIDRTVLAGRAAVSPVADTPASRACGLEGGH